MRRNKYTSYFFVFCFFITMFSCSNAAAGTDLQQQVNAYEISLSYSYLPSRAAEAISGEIEFVKSINGFSRELELFEKLPVRFSLETQYTDISNTAAFELPPNLTAIAAGIEATAHFFDFDNTYLRLGLSPAFYTQDWNISVSSFRLPSRGYFIYQPDSQLTWIFGIAVYPGYENEFLPVLGVIYKPNDKLSFNIIPKDPNISYTVTDSMSVFAEAGRSVNSEFEVTRGTVKNTVLSCNETRAGAGIKYKFNKYIQGVFSSGGVFGRSLKYRDTSGKLAIKDGMYFEWRIMVDM